MDSDKNTQQIDNQVNKHYNKYILGAVLLLMIVISSLMFRSQVNNNIQQTTNTSGQVFGEHKIVYRCPNEYESTAEYFNSISNFINQYKTENPNASSADILTASREMMSNMGCSEVNEQIPNIDASTSPNLN